MNERREMSMLVMSATSQTCHGDLDALVGTAATDIAVHVLDDFFAGEIEDRLENLRTLLRIRLPDDEKHACAVLDVAG